MLYLLTHVALRWPGTMCLMSLVEERQLSSYGCVTENQCLVNLHWARSLMQYSLAEKQRQMIFMMVFCLLTWLWSRGMYPDRLMQVIYKHFVNYRFVDLRFVYKLNTKTSYSWLTKPKTLKLNAKTGGSAPRTPLSCLWLAISNWSAKIIDESRQRIDSRRTEDKPK